MLSGGVQKEVFFFRVPCVTLREETEWVETGYGVRYEGLGVKGEGMRKHHELKVWQEAMKLVNTVYEITGKFPRHEQHALTAQLCRAAISVPSNVVEGAARNSAKEFVQCLMVARGSLSELETQMLIAKNLGYITEEKTTAFQEQIDPVFALIGGLLRSVRQRSAS